MNYPDMQVCVLLCQVVYAPIFDCLRYYVACTTLVRALLYCNFLKEVRLGGWGQTRKCVRYYTQVACATMLGCVRYYVRLRVPPLCVHQYIVTSLQRLGQVAGARHASACALILRLRSLLYQVACATKLDCVSYFIRLHVPGAAVYSGPKGPCPPPTFSQKYIL